MKFIFIWGWGILPLFRGCSQRILDPYRFRLTLKTNFLSFWKKKLNRINLIYEILLPWRSIIFQPLGISTFNVCKLYYDFISIDLSIEDLLTWLAFSNASLSVCLSGNQFLRTLKTPLVHSLPLSANLFVRFRVGLSVCLSIYWPGCLSVCVFVCRFIRLSDWLTVLINVTDTVSVFVQKINVWLDSSQWVCNFFSPPYDRCFYLYQQFHNYHLFFGALLWYNTSLCPYIYIYIYSNQFASINLFICLFISIYLSLYLKSNWKLKEL